MDALIRNRAGRPHEIFFEEVRNCAEIERRIAPAHQCRPVSVMKDFSYRIEKMAGDGWIAIGDAFSFIDPVYSSGVFLALKSGEMAAEASIGAIAADDLSGERLGAFQPLLMRGVEAVRQLVNVFYDPNFSVGAFLRLHAEHQSKVTRILIGDVFELDFTSMFEDMAAFAAAGGGKSTPSRPENSRVRTRVLTRRLRIHGGEGGATLGLRGAAGPVPPSQRPLVLERR